MSMAAGSVSASRKAIKSANSSSASSMGSSNKRVQALGHLVEERGVVLEGLAHVFAQLVYVVVLQRGARVQVVAHRVFEGGVGAVVHPGAGLRYVAQGRCAEGVAIAFVTGYRFVAHVVGGGGGLAGAHLGRADVVGLLVRQEGAAVAITAAGIAIKEAMRRRLRAAQPFDTAAALRQTALPAPASVAPTGGGAPGTAPLPRAIGQLVSAGDPDTDLAMLLAAPADSFEHAEHETLTCIQCHRTSEGHGGLTFEPPRGCQICHHQAPSRSDCSDCHESAVDLATASVEVHIQPTPDAETVRRPATFVHEVHAEAACVDCHEVPVTLAAAEASATCTGCHDEHHMAEIACADCHAGGDLSAMETAHAPPEPAHEACATCHTPETVLLFEPDRPFCLACHAEDAEHEPDGQCTTCHLMESPETFRPRLATDTRADR